MDDMEEKLGAILNNPQMMQQIMSLAQGFQQEKSPQKGPPPCKPEPKQDFSLPEIDLGMVQKLSRLAKQSNIDKREQALLRALGAYLSRERLSKLEKAMKAAKLAKLATSAIGAGGNPF